MLDAKRSQLLHRSIYGLNPTRDPAILSGGGTFMSDTQTCPTCGVSIVRDVVYFSNGSPGSRARLYARVCQYAKQRDCLNQDADKIGLVGEGDRYAPMPQISRAKNS